MTQFVSFEKGIEVNGQTIYAIVDAMAVKFLTEKIFEQAGLPSISEIQSNPHGWYSQQKWLDAFKMISDKIGHSSLLAIGKKIPENAQFPSDIDCIEKALASIDVAYHMNHRNAKGEVLFIPETGEMLEGIGHYKFEKIADTKGIMECENPYPCDFDQGIIISMARKFAKFAIVEHMGGPCRKKGDNLCRYEINW